ncbi:MAG: hypothetical protein IJ680_01315 [Paludibacteraceae bacterium]|nr:hypothetical protein [Clostridia bacterium]MBQ9229057.1 hypothetical protein [Eubacterium sp.]MBR1630472.1 hypothetical protein [Paludibacteraceae bacterium]
MTRADAAKLIAIIVMAYPNFDKFKDDEHIKGVVNMWATMFADDDAGLVGLAVKKHISVSKWPPSVAEIREIMAEIQHPELIPPDLAWSAVQDLMKAKGEYGLYGSLYTYLPELIARAVESLGGYNAMFKLHVSPYRDGGKPGMDRVAFMAQYTPLYEREKSRAMCGTALTAAIDNTTAKIDNPESEKLKRLQQKRQEEEERHRRFMEGHNSNISLLASGNE